MTTATDQRGDRRIGVALDEFKRKHAPESLTAADLAAVARCLNDLRSMVARVRSVTTSEVGLSGWGPLSPRDRPDDGTAQTAAAGLRVALDGFWRTRTRPCWTLPPCAERWTAGVWR